MVTSRIHTLVYLNYGHSTELPVLNDLLFFGQIEKKQLQISIKVEGVYVFAWPHDRGDQQNWNYANSVFLLNV